jgi:hypothetical protein
MTTSYTLITGKDECVEHCKELFETQLGHPLIFSRKGCNNYRFTLVCKNCHIEVVSAMRSRKQNEETTFVLVSHNVTPIHVHPAEGTWCHPTIVGKKASTIRELSQSEVLNVVVNDLSMSSKYKGMSTQAKKSLLANSGYGDVTVSAVKNATALLKITPTEHIQSYKAIIPYFIQWKKQNPKLCYDIEPKLGGVFHRLTVVMPYTSEFLPNMLNVFGLDGGFMPEVPVKGDFLFKLMITIYLINWYNISK